MTRDHLIRAVNEGIPFVIKMADGEQYKVTDRYKLPLGNTTVIVIRDDEMPPSCRC